MDDHATPPRPPPTRSAAGPWCPGCGYPLDGLAEHGTCPECGDAYTPDTVRRTEPGRWSTADRLIVGALVALALLPVLVCLFLAVVKSVDYDVKH